MLLHLSLSYTDFCLNRQLTKLWLLTFSVLQVDYFSKPAGLPTEDVFPSNKEMCHKHTELPRILCVAAYNDIQCNGYM
jgi:hypothetical protein